MKFLPLCLALALITAPATAQNAALPVVAAPKMATVTPFITGLKEPRGMAFAYLSLQSDIFVVDSQAGEILRYGQNGKTQMTLATGLKEPTTIVKTATDVYVTERGANRVLRFESTDLGYLYPPETIGETISQPLGLAFRAGRPSPDQPVNGPVEWMRIAEELITTSPTTSQIFGFSLNSLWEKKWKPIYSSSKISANSCLVFDGSALFMTDDINGEVLMISLQGRAAIFATGISKPAGLAFGPDQMLYVANEGDGGQLIRLSNEGAKTVVAEKLGRPDSLLFLDAKTLLVSNRDGNIWKVVLP